MCRCGADKSCLDNQFVCNCDASIKDWKQDVGRITNPGLLPVTELSFGGLISYFVDGAEFLLGPLACTGRKVIIGDTIRGSSTILENAAILYCCMHSHVIP
jgi:hypothetical protein